MKSYFAEKSINKSAQTEVQDKNSLEQFLAGIWESDVQHIEKADWIIKEQNRWLTLQEMKFEKITETDIEKVTAKIHNQKSPGSDKIHNFQ